jgi:hypothetical protein
MTTQEVTKKTRYGLVFKLPQKCEFCLTRWKDWWKLSCHYLQRLDLILFIAATCTASWFVLLFSFLFFFFFFFFFVWGADFLFLFFFFVDKGATVDNYYCFLFSNCLIRAVPTKKKAPAWSVVDVVALHSIASVKEIPDMSGIGLSKRKGTCLVLFSLRDVFLFVQKANGFEIGVTRMKGEGFQLEKSDVLAMCAPSARFFSFLEKSFFLTFVGLSEKSAWLAKLGNFLERWRGGEEGARVLLDATLKLLDEHSAPAPVPGLVVFVAMCV